MVYIFYLEDLLQQQYFKGITENLYFLCIIYDFKLPNFDTSKYLLFTSTTTYRQEKTM